MNIFELYTIKIKQILSDLSKKGELILPEKLDGINTEIPPSQFNFDTLESVYPPEATRIIYICSSV